MIAAVATARGLPQLSLDDALELAAMIARRDPARYDEHPDLTIAEAALAAFALVALPGAGYGDGRADPEGPGRELNAGRGAAARVHRAGRDHRPGPPPGE